MRIKVIVLVIILIMLSSVSYAEIVSYEAGVIGDPTMDDGVYEYAEYFFLTGEPILLTGTVTVDDIPDKDNYSITYEFELSNTDKNIEVIRKIDYDVTNNVNDNMMQTLYHAKIKKIDESITVDGVDYNLASYQFDRTKLIDNTPAVDYYLGDVHFERKYYINGDAITNDGIIKHEINLVTDTGYNHYWGDSETLVLEHFISKKALPTDDGFIWTGFITTKNSSIDKKRFRYNKTETQNISFRGSYTKSNTMENIAQCTYDLPTVTGTTVNQNIRVKSESNISRDIVTDYQSLLSPKINDIGGHWAEEDIFLLKSLGIFENSSEFFHPNQLMNRSMFGKAIVNSLTNIESLDFTDRVIRDRDRGDEKLYTDIENNDPDYEYYKYLKDKKIMIGNPSGSFGPYDALNRAQAVKTIVNALGLEHLAPSPPYDTKFVDDKEIPNWAKDSIYVATEIGIVNGYPDGTFRPYEPLTKAHTAALIMRLIKHIKDNITEDYREKIINKY